VIDVRDADLELDLEAAWEPLRSDESSDAASVYVEPLNRCPVAHVGGMFGSFWAVLGNEELVRAAHDTATFSNVVPMFGTRRPPLECDPPEHRTYRRLLNPYFSREKVSAMEPRLRGLAVEMLSDLVDAGAIEFVDRFSYAYPSRALCLLLGIPDADWILINEWSATVDREVGTSRPGSDAHIKAGERLHPYMRCLVEERRRTPIDGDLVSAIVAGDPELPPIEDEAVVGMLMMLLSAGHNTTTSALGNLILRVARDPALQDRLRTDPSLIPAAVEESVRIDAPQQAMRRIATKDVEVAGHSIKKDEFVWLVFGAANLDATAVSDPTDFRLDRVTNRHHGFGRGIHLCLGAPLARLQIRVVLEELLVRAASIEVAGKVARPAWPRMGVSELWLRLSSTT
jgi:cytochrome P450